MERLDKEFIGPIYIIRPCSASSIQDMVDGADSIADDIYKEHSQWMNTLGFKGKLQHIGRSIAFLLDSPDTFTYIILPHRGKPYPYIESSPRTLVVLPPVSCVPDNNYSGLEVGDITGSLHVEFPYGATESLRRGLGLKINQAALRSNSWSSRVALLHIYSPNKFFLMHVFNDKANEMAEDEVRNWAAKMAPTRA